MDLPYELNSGDLNIAEVNADATARPCVGRRAMYELITAALTRPSVRARPL